VSLEALGMQSGFRSRSRFYAAFEEAYGETPGARRERLKAAD
jgi:methylphosphotriester-DNA--protein-cysteine methyltransferase